LPVLTIIAGPNGAGKSTLSKGFLSESRIEAFDFDKEFYSIWSQFSYDPAIEQGAFSRTSDLYLERRTSALESNSDFAFETNFHTNDVLNVVDLFKSKGFECELIFICLESVELAIQRVKIRVSQGGHAVDETTIRSRFDSGLKLLDNTFDKFDLVTIYTSIPNQVLLSCVLEPPLDTMITLDPISKSLKPFLPKLLDRPALNIE
jgi:predicted ABC-type ATPase